jgi:hypothetical protein
METTVLPTGTTWRTLSTTNDLPGGINRSVFPRLPTLHRQCTISHREARPFHIGRCRVNCNSILKHELIEISNTVYSPPPATPTRRQAFSHHRNNPAAMPFTRASLQAQFVYTANAAGDGNRLAQLVRDHGKRLTPATKDAALRATCSTLPKTITRPVDMVTCQWCNTWSKQWMLDVLLSTEVRDQNVCVFAYGLRLQFTRTLRLSIRLKCRTLFVDVILVCYGCLVSSTTVPVSFVLSTCVVHLVPRYANKQPDNHPCSFSLSVDMKPGFPDVESVAVFSGDAESITDFCIWRVLW